MFPLNGNLTALVNSDHAANSRTDVRGRGSGDRHGVLCTSTDVRDIGLR